jgi:hypothetical protein
MLMTTKAIGRKATHKPVTQSATAKTKAKTRVVSPKKALAKAAPVNRTASPSHRSEKTNAPIASPAATKQSQLIIMLSALPGATIAQMMALTGWQAHTVRGTISGVLRKRLGLNVACAPNEAGASASPAARRCVYSP